ncbi:DoxX family protein [Actinoplanes sp. NPDC024001]|uniref:DoxX family protein n=1 Tax=Actinoplanes sp. NPDC024001 TaxID=3154598 RepID=UPI00340BD4CF
MTVQVARALAEVRTAMNFLFAAIAIPIFGVHGVAQLTAGPGIHRHADRLGVSASGLRFIGRLELVCAAGTAIGLAVTPVGAVAAVILLLLMAGAVATHVLIQDPPAVTLRPMVVAAVLTAYLITL